MSKVAVKGAVAGTGVFTLESPGTNTDRTFTLPDGDGELVRAATAGGMPLAGSDPVVESGSNSDGGWVRYADGTQICSKAQVVSTAASSTAGFGGVFTFPASFISTGGLTIVPSALVNDSNDDINITCSYRQLTASSVRIVGAKLQTTGSVALGAVAIGRWK